MNADLRMETSDGVLRIVLDRPDRRNALSRALIASLGEQLRAADRDSAVGVAVLTGAPPAFCAGLDLGEVESALGATGDFDTGPLADLLDLICRIDLPVVAAVNGTAAAGGAALVCACDYAIMAGSATIGYPGIRRGLVAPVVVPSLVAAVGPRRARALLLSGRMLSAGEALAAGLCDEVVAHDALVRRADELARDLVGIGPAALGETKRLVREVRVEGDAAATARFRRVWRAAPQPGYNVPQASGDFERRSPAARGSPARKHAMQDRIRKYTELGQAIWLDFISRDLLTSGKLREWIGAGVTGMTSNPSIFQKAIAAGSEYDAQLRELARAGRNAMETYEALVIRDIQDAADQLRGTYDERAGRDGFVSLEVDPQLADDTDKTIAEARRLFQTIERPNVMIKVPATPAGLPAIRTLIAEGVNVNVTLIFSIEMYERVMQAYIDGLRARLDAGQPLGRVASVASFFVSRVDTLVDKLLTERLEAGEMQVASLRGQAAIANAKIAYDRFRHVFGGEAFATLKAAGARLQRPLWASTSTKNPAYPDTKYVDGLVGPDTVNTVPPHTLEAVCDHGIPARTIDLYVDEAYAVIEKLHALGIDMKDVTQKLLEDGVRLFAEAFEKMIADIDAKRRSFV